MIDAPWQHVIFDLDGTLTDSRIGITRSWAHALTTLGYEAPSLQALERYIGPPTRDVVKLLLQTEDALLIERVVAVYRERFSTVGLFENDVYPGIDALLTALVERGRTLWVCTGKPRVYAQRIAEHFRFVPRVRAVYGPELDGTRGDKAELLAYLLAREGIAANSAVMIGDREHDVVAARAAGVHSIGVLYGYGSEAELREAGASELRATVEALTARLTHSG